MLYHDVVTWASIAISASILLKHQSVGFDHFLVVRESQMILFFPRSSIDMCRSGREREREDWTALYARCFYFIKVYVCTLK
jgi:hypothetical protein